MGGEGAWVERPGSYQPVSKERNHFDLQTRPLPSFPLELLVLRRALMGASADKRWSIPGIGCPIPGDVPPGNVVEKRPENPSRD